MGRTAVLHNLSEPRKWLLSTSTPAWRLSLHFNHKGFAMDVKLIAKPLAFVLFTDSQAAFLIAG